MPSFLFFLLQEEAAHTSLHNEGLDKSIYLSDAIEYMPATCKVKNVLLLKDMLTQFIYHLGSFIFSAGVLFEKNTVLNQ